LRSSESWRAAVTGDRKARQQAYIRAPRSKSKNLESAISKYEADYSRYPASPKAREAAKDGDFTFGTMNLSPVAPALLKDRKGNNLPLIENTPGGSDYENSNAEVMSALMDSEKYRYTMKTPNFGHVLNPNKAIYLNVKEVSDFKSPGVGQDGVYRDPWGNPYIITLDLNGDNKCRDAFYKRG